MADVYVSILCILLIAIPAQSQSGGELIEDVQVLGNHRVPTDTIKYRIQTKAGDRVSSQTVSRDLRTLYSLGYFENIRVEEQRGVRGPIVVFHVQERPLIQAIKYEGLQSATTSEILEMLRNRRAEISPNTPYDPARVRRAEAAIKQTLFEKGHRDAAVDVRIENVENNVTVVFEVNEGPKLKIQDISFEGNEAFSDRELKRVMKLINES